MSLFIKRIVLFGLLASLLMYFIEILLMGIPNQYTLRRDKLDNDPESVKVLVMGHSQLLQAINPDWLGDSVFNCARKLSGTYYDYHILKQYISKMPNLRCILYPLSNIFGNTSGWHGNLTAQATPADEFRNYVVCMHLKYMNVKPINGYSYFFWPELLWNRSIGMPLYRIFDYYLGPGSMVPNGNKNGWEPVSGQLDTEWDAFPNKIIHNRQTPSMTPEELSCIEYATLFAELCAQHGVRLVLLTPPNYRNHEIGVDSTSRDAMRAFINAMREGYPLMEYYDYSSDMRFDDDDFFDTIHMNEDGAKKMT